MSKELMLYIEEFAMQLEMLGGSRSSGRILAWLLTAEPPHQTMTDMVENLSMSKSSVSTATRQLIQLGMVERISLPGERKDFYRIKGNVWAKMMKARGYQITIYRELAERGLELLQDSPPERKQRLMEMRDLYAFFEQEMPLLLERYYEFQAKKRDEAV